MTIHDDRLAMMMTGLERAGRRLVDDPNPADTVLERQAFQLGIQSQFQRRTCVSCWHDFDSVGTHNVVCIPCRNKDSAVDWD